MIPLLLLKGKIAEDAVSNMVAAAKGKPALWTLAHAIPHDAATTKAAAGYAEQAAIREVHELLDERSPSRNSSIDTPCAMVLPNK